MKIRPVAAELFHADEQVECELDRQSDAETWRWSLFAICESP
jgi:hypothetical protein